MIMSSLRLGERIPWIRWIARLSAGDVRTCSAVGRGCAGRRGVTGGGEVAELEKLPKFPKKSHQNLKAV
jgi:hypothetical protein